ncbi:restriction endonuclease subunit S [Helicobacter pylori]|uniref:restriction endonuclease subunit S n=1 Tax=Helicobacter pylori TaxID=210 RepID=UPI001FD6118F|nr:restriction endonuclease subunit S [Helicobacter pylori]UOS48506.1 restriction endonuclease subunit S [Helicobacter pylori]
MHKIERLLQTLAPKGVEFRKLGEVINIFKGKQLNKELLLDYGEYPVMNGGIHASGYWNEYNTDYPKIIISQGGASAGYVNYMTSKFWAGAHCYAIELNSEKLNYKFLYYFLKNSQTILMKSQFGAGIPALNKADIETLTIPIPPLEIQQEIVKILDAFTELNTELKARKKQYQYYQNMLLDFKDINQNHKDATMSAKTYPKRLKSLLQTLAPKGVEFRKLGDIGEFYSGLVGKSKKSFSQGNKFYVPYVNVFNNPQLDLNALESVQIGDKEKQNTIQLGDVLFTGSSENLEDCAMSCVVTQKIEKDIYLNSFCFGFRFFDENLFNPSFLKHFLRDYNFRKNISKVANGVTRFNVSKQLLSKITIPIPPLEIQQEIVKILDQFSVLTTDLQAGIPAEIKARKKQYEYYREKLLAFKPLTPHKEVKKC